MRNEGTVVRNGHEQPRRCGGYRGRAEVEQVTADLWDYTPRARVPDSHGSARVQLVEPVLRARRPQTRSGSATLRRGMGDAAGWSRAGVPVKRLARASGLRALVNVEGNFNPNVDDEACAKRGVYLLGCGPAYVQVVVEYWLGLVLDLARGISRGDWTFREGRERYVAAGHATTGLRRAILSSHADTILLRHADVGLIGFGNLGLALHRFLLALRPTIRVCDGKTGRWAGTRSDRMRRQRR